MRWNDRYNATVIMLCIMLLGTVVIWFTRALTHAGIEIPGVGMHGIYVLSLYNAIVASVTVTVSMIILTNERINGKLLALALKDPLTGAMNRRAFHESSRTILGNDSRDAGSNAVCLIDLDNFKMINDTYGHATGDRILARFSQLAMSILREGDLFSRYGGEEFVVLLMNCTIQDAEETMERLRRAWEQEEFAVEGRVVRNTISAGVVQVEEKTAFDLDKVLGYADTLLYRAKETGRNRVESAVYA
jgi:diguanylate cyclase (GGDEF)-like protein